MAVKFNAYLIHCITNMHAGSGDTEYGTVDKLVQRDPVTQFPTIHASSLKGALREHFEKRSELKVDVNKIFGKEGKDGDDSESGTHIFLNADLLFLPVRSTHKQFVLGMSKQSAGLINAKSSSIINKKIVDENILHGEDVVYGSDVNVFAEDFELTAAELIYPFIASQTLTIERYACFKESHFAELAKSLPVVARNKVGVDKNLWYEEIVPHQTVFVAFIGATEANDDFDNALKEGLVQIGGNASVGYGLCKFILVNNLIENHESN